MARKKQGLAASLFARRPLSIAPRRGARVSEWARNALRGLLQESLRIAQGRTSGEPAISGIEEQLIRTG